MRGARVRYSGKLSDPRASARLSGLCGGVLLLASATSAQVAGRPVHETYVLGDAGPAPKPSWEFRAEPSVWYSSPGGRISLPGQPDGSPRVRLEELNVDSPRLAPALELHGRSGLWRGMFSGYSVAIERDATLDEPLFLGPLSASAGDEVRTSLRMTSFEAELARTVVDSQRWRSLDRTPGVADVRFTLEALGGLRAFVTSIDASIVGSALDNAEAREIFAHPYIGARMEFEIIEGFSFDLRSSFGWIGAIDERESWSWDMLVGFRYEFAGGSGIQLGYRQSAFGLFSEDDEFVWRGANAGLYAGFTIRY